MALVAVKTTHSKTKQTKKGGGLFPDAYQLTWNREN